MFGPALTLVLALASSAVIASTYCSIMSINVPLPRSTLRPLSSHSISLNLSMRAFPTVVLPHRPPPRRMIVKTATDFIFKRLNLGADDFKVQISTLPKGIIIVSAPEATLSFEEVSSTVSAQLKIPVYSEFEHVLEYVAQSDGKIVYAYKFQLRDDPCDQGGSRCGVMLPTGKVIQAINFSKKASYKAISIPHRDPNEGFSVVSNPEFKRSSPKGWTAGRVTKGNNVITSNPRGKATRSVRNGVFNTKFDTKKQAGHSTNIAAAAVNLFYVSNVMHDISYQYGFTEQAGNFQKSNFGKGGQGNDAIVINVLDPSDTNNAEFFTSP
ncbi:hypothetical protein BASA81_017112 [Batrachochytrium salamandrivorans]|nr:hypothetical protein BASA81_017112 [Batrachochytrium salamandrivorans]